MKQIGDSPSGPALWRRMAARYEWLVERMVPGANEFFDVCARQIPGGPVRILELGSGTGYATERILRQNPDARLTCLDLSEKMLACARAKTALRRVKFVVGDIRDSWPDGPVDVIFSTLCLHHIAISERRQLVRKARARLGAGGVFINGDIFKPSARARENTLRQRWLSDMRRRGLSAEEARDMLAKRRDNYPCFDTFGRHRAALLSARFDQVVCAWRREFAAVWVARK